MTKACLHSVLQQARRKEFELLVVDNASRDGSADTIEREFPDRVRLIKSKENLGFAKGNNAAAEFASGDYILLLNPDTVILDGAVDRLLEFAEKKSRCRDLGRTYCLRRRLIEPDFLLAFRVVVVGFHTIPWTVLCPKKQ